MQHTHTYNNENLLIAASCVACPITLSLSSHFSPRLAEEPITQFITIQLKEHNSFDQIPTSKWIQAFMAKYQYKVS